VLKGAKFRTRFEVKISKTLFARQLGVAPSTISGYLAKGMPTAIDGTIDPSLAKKWIRANIRIQGGKRGVGARAARKADSESLDPKDDAVAQHARLTRLKADKLELETARMRGGTDSERQLALAEATALECWFCFQRATRAALAAAFACEVNRQRDNKLMYRCVAFILGRDQAIMRDVHKVLCDGFAGLIDPLPGGAVGVPWRTEPRGRNGETP
jgi:hypothetical protein